MSPRPAPRGRPGFTGLACLLLLAASGCTLLEYADDDAEREVVERDGLDVVDDEGPFDPSEVVEGPKDGRERLTGDLGKAPEENVSKEEEVAALKAQREEGVESADHAEDDEDAKRSVATNPEPQDPGPAESPWSAKFDVVAELLLLVILAVPLTMAVVAARRYPRTTLAAVAALGAVTLAT